MNETPAPWPIVARLECGHFEVFTFETSPTMGQKVLCLRCSRARETADPLEIRTAVEASISVSDLVRIVDARRCVQHGFVYSAICPVCGPWWIEEASDDDIDRLRRIAASL